MIFLQTNNFTEEISSPQNVSYELNNSLKNYFYIDDPAPYENILIAELGFNFRIQKCLTDNGYNNLADLLNASRKKLRSLKNFGRVSFKSLLETLSKFFDSRGEKVSVKTLQFTEEKLAAFKNPSAPAIEKFFSELPDEIKNKKVRFYLPACDLTESNSFTALPEDLTVANFPAHFADNPSKFDAEELKIFAAAMYFDVKAFTKKFFADLFKSKREFDMIILRAEKSTLVSIGKNFGVTRERIRQVELKSIKKFLNKQNAVKKIICFMYALTDGKSFITPNDLKNFLDEKDAEILQFFAVKTNFQCDDFYFDNEINSFVFHNKNALENDDLIKNLPDVMEETVFDETITNLAREKNCSAELIKTKLLKIYNHSGKFFHRDRLNLTFKCAYVLKENFPDGYKVGNKNFYSRFIQCFKKIFGKNSYITQRALDALIAKVGVLCSRGKYIHADFVHVPPEIIERIKNFIENSDRTAIFYKEIFGTLKNYFVGTQITNRYFLQGVIKLYNLPYTFRKDYITKADEIDMAKEFDNFVAERGEVTIKEIKENFRSLTDTNVNFLLLRCPEVIRAGNGKIIYSSRLNLQENDFEPIKNFLNQNCSKPLTSRALFNLFSEYFADFMARNEIQSHNKLFDVLRYMFPDDFNFSRPFISTIDLKNLNNKKVLLDFLKDIDEIKTKDLVALCEENQMYHSAKNYLIEILRPNFIRRDEFTLIRPESIGVTDEIIFAVAETIRAEIEKNGGWKAIHLFSGYDKLPQLKISWNSFLLEGVIMLAEDPPYRLRIPSASIKVSSAIFISEEFVAPDFESFLIKILVNEHAKNPFHSEAEIFDWLNMQGLCNKKLPMFLEHGKALEILGEQNA